MAEYGNPARDEALAVVTRAGLTENIHRGRFCIVSAEGGRLEAFSGDVEAPAFVRSTAKPFQAIAPLLGGIAEAYGWEERHLAMMAASHRGYPEQIAALEEMLARSVVPEEALVFHAGKPMASAALETWARGGGRQRKLYHMCAGKHLGMLAWCRLQGWPLEGYHEPEHPAQREILRRVREWSGAGEEECTIGRDGCGLPVPAIPLKRIALAYARLACPDTAPATAAAETVKKVASAMNRYPDLVEGPDSLASLLLSDPNIVAKSGAQGLFAIGLRKEGLGIALHMSDGAAQAWPHVVAKLLDRFGGVAERTQEQLRSRYPADYSNDAGMVAGRWETVF